MSKARKFVAGPLYAIAHSLSGMCRALYRLVKCPGSHVSTYCVPVGGVQLPLTLPLINSARIQAHHRQTHDLFVEVHDPKCKLTGTKHLRHQRGLDLGRCAGAYPPSATVDQPVLPALLQSVSFAPEMATAEPKKLTRLDTTQASSPMRTDRIQNTRHPNLPQNAVLRSKTGKTT